MPSPPRLAGCGPPFGYRARPHAKGFRRPDGGAPQRLRPRYRGSAREPARLRRPAPSAHRRAAHPLRHAMPAWRGEHNDLGPVAAGISPDPDRRKAHPRMATTKMVLDLGRSGGPSGNLAASGNFGMMIRRTPLMHRIGPSAALEEKHDISRPALHLDRQTWQRGHAAPHGDLLAVHGGGAYGPRASPLRFQHTSAAHRGHGERRPDPAGDPAAPGMGVRSASALARKHLQTR